MHRRGFLIIAILLVALLGACASLIPDQQVEDLFGFSGFRIDMGVSASLLQDGVAPQAAEIVAAGSVKRVVDAGDFDLPFDPTSARESVRAQWIRLLLPTPDAELPGTLSLDRASFEVNFTDGNDSFSKLVSADFSPGALFERDDASCTSNRCDYLPVGDVVASLEIGISGSDIVEVLAILDSGFEPKVASGDATLYFSDDPLLAAVSQAQLLIETFGGVISFR